MKRFSISADSILTLYACTQDNTPDYCQYVDPFIGAADNRHTFPEATAPFGFILASPETGNDSWDSVRLNDFDIEVELTATQRIAFHPYIFNKNAPANLSKENKYVQVGGTQWAEIHRQKHLAQRYNERRTGWFSQ